MCTEVIDTIIDAKMWLRLSSLLPCLITQLCCTFISDVELDAYTTSHVQMVLRIYWWPITLLFYMIGINAASKKYLCHRSYPIGGLCLFYQDLPTDPNEQIHVVWHGSEKNLVKTKAYGLWREFECMYTMYGDLSQR